MERSMNPNEDGDTGEDGEEKDLCESRV